VAVIHAGTAETERIAIREAFCNREDKSIQFLLISYRTSGFGLNFHADCHNMVLYEQAININSELQAICRVFRVGQRHSVFVTRLISKNAIDGHRNFKQGEKMLSEVVGGLAALSQSD
jgi:SNF2 family DNA or RNA helicase